MKKIVQLVALLSLVIATMFATSYVGAQSTGLGVGPRVDVSILPGQTFTDKLPVTNLNKKVPLKITLTVIDFKAADQTGTPALDLKKDAPQTAWSLRSFITLPQSVTVKPGETVNIPYSIHIPKEQGAGSYYSAIRYTAQGANGQNVTISASAATLAFVTVPGRATELMSLKQFGPYSMKDGQENGKFQSFFVGSTPNRLAYTLENVGNVAESPSGSIEIKNIFGKQVKLVDSANPNGSLALIGQTRRFDVCLNPQEKKVKNGSIEETVNLCGPVKLWPGIYKAHLNVFYGLNGSNTQEINATKTYWYMPWWSVAVLVLVIAIVAYAIFKVRRAFVGGTVHRRNKRK